MRISIAKTGDLSMIKRIDKTFFPEADLSEDGLENSVWWVAREGEEIVGYAGLYVGLEKECWLIRLGVKREYRRLGIGARLLRVRLKHWKKFYRGCELYTYVAGWNVGSSKNLINGGLCPYRVEGEWVYWWREGIN